MDFAANPPPCYTDSWLYKQQIHRGIDPYRLRQEENLGSAMKLQSAQINVTGIRRSASSPEAHRDPHSSVLPLLDFFFFKGMWNNFQGAKRLVKVPLAVHVHVRI